MKIAGTLNVLSQYREKVSIQPERSLKGLGLIVRWRILFHESICKTRVTMYQDSVQCWSETGEHTPRGLPVRESKGL